MRLQRALDDILRGRSSVRVLRALIEMPEGVPASAREVARRASVSHPTASGVLATLVEQGVVQVRRAPRGDAFELNTDHILFPILGPLFARERSAHEELVSLLRAKIAPLKVSKAFLFGSAARKDAEASSDIDVAVMCAPASEPAVTEALDAASEVIRRLFGNTLNAVVETGDPARRPGTRRLWKRIETEGIPLVEPETMRALRA